MCVVFWNAFVMKLCVCAELVMYWLGALCSSTERAKARLWKHQYIDYGYEIPDNIMALLLGLTFCIISPLIAPIALLYFVVNSVIGKYTLIYVYAERFQSGGKVSPSTGLVEGQPCSPLHMLHAEPRREALASYLGICD